MDNQEEPMVQESTRAPVEAQPAPAKSNRSALLIVFLVVFIDLFGFGIVLPLLPRIAEEFIPGGRTNPLNGMILGLLMASFSAMQFIFAPIWGRVSDRVGRRPILLMGLVSSVIFYTLFGFASMLGTEGNRQLGLVLLFVARLGAGIAGATISTAQAVIADSTTREGRSRGMALIGAAFGIGFFFGPLIGAAAFFFLEGHEDQAYYYGVPGFLAATLSLIAGVLGFLLLPETLRPGGEPHGRRNWFDARGFRSVLQVPNLGTLILTFFLSTLAFANFEPTLALLTKSHGLHLSNKYNFLVFAYVGLVLALSQGVLYRRLALRVRELTFMELGTALMMLGLSGVGVIAYYASEPLAADQERALDRKTLLVLLFMILAVAITGFAFVVPSVQALISRLSDPRKQGEILGINQSANAMARILGPFFGMVLYESTSTHILPYVFGAALLLMALLITLHLRKAGSIAMALSKEEVHAE